MKDVSSSPPDLPSIPLPSRSLSSELAAGPPGFVARLQEGEREGQMSFSRLLVVPVLHSEHMPPLKGGCSPLLAYSCVFCLPIEKGGSMLAFSQHRAQGLAWVKIPSSAWPEGKSCRYLSRSQRPAPSRISENLRPSRQGEAWMVKSLEAGPGLH